MGSHVIKQLQVLIGKPILLWSVEAFLEETEVDHILISYPPNGYSEDFLALISHHAHRVKLVEGGETRYRSVRNGFEAISFESEKDVVLVHDAARPLASPGLIERVRQAAELHGAAVPVLPVQETLKEVHGNNIVGTFPREQLFFSQTPQGFTRRVLESAYRMIDSEPEELITDEAMLVEMAGFPVFAVPGEKRNIKITRPEDLELAEFYLNMEQE